MNCISPRKKRKKNNTLKGKYSGVRRRMGSIRTKETHYEDISNLKENFSYLWNRIGSKHLIPVWAYDKGSNYKNRLTWIVDITQYQVY